MVMNTLVWKGKAKRPEDEINVETKTVDLFQEEQFDENFLCNVNDHGQVLLSFVLLYLATNAEL